MTIFVVENLIVMMKKILLPLLLLFVNNAFFYGMEGNPIPKGKVFRLRCFYKEEEDSQDAKSILPKNAYILLEVNKKYKLNDSEVNVDNLGKFGAAVCKDLGFTYDVKKHFLSIDIKKKNQSRYEETDITEDNKDDSINIDNIITNIYLTILSSNKEDCEKISDKFDKQKNQITIPQYRRQAPLNNGQDSPLKKGLKIGFIILLAVAACWGIYYFFIRRKEEQKVDQTIDEKKEEEEE